MKSWKNKFTLIKKIIGNFLKPSAYKGYDTQTKKGVIMKTLKENKDKKVVIENKQDVIDWIEYMKEGQGFHVRKLWTSDYEKQVEVCVEGVIIDRYDGMLEWLRSDEVA